MTDELYAAERERRAGQTEAARKARTQALDDVARIAATPEGLRFFRRFLTLGHFYETTFSGNNVGIFREGRKSLAIQLFLDLRAACPEILQPLLTEENEK